MHPYTLCFYIKFGPYFFNYDVFGLESFLELMSLNFIPWHFIFISNMVLIFLLLFLVVLILFFNWNSFPISSLMICFFSFCIKFDSLSFQIYFFSKKKFQFVFSCLSQIILVGLEFYVVIFYFYFAFYNVIWPYDLCYKFWSLNRVRFNHF